MYRRFAVACEMFAMMCAISITALAKNEAEIVFQKDLVYTKIGDTGLTYDIARPGEGAGPFPVVLCIHAGGWQLGDKRSFRDDIRRLAAKGYVAATINFRVTPGAKWPAQLEDVRSAVRYFRAHAAELKIDPARFGAIGDDSGGHLAMMLGLVSAQDEKDKPIEQSTRIQAVVNIFGPTDLREWRVSSGWVEAKIRIGFFKSSEQIFEDFLGTRDRTAQICYEASPIAHVTPNAPPVLTIVGTADPLITLDQPKAFHDALKKAGVPEEMMIVEGGEHDRKSFKENSGVDPRWEAFFDKYLKAPPPAK
jgi:acetyl esterase/lipase